MSNKLSISLQCTRINQFWLACCFALLCLFSCKKEADYELSTSQLQIEKQCSNQLGFSGDLSSLPVIVSEKDGRYFWVTATIQKPCGNPIYERIVKTDSATIIQLSATNNGSLHCCCSERIRYEGTLNNSGEIANVFIQVELPDGSLYYKKLKLSQEYQ